MTEGVCEYRAEKDFLTLENPSCDPYNNLLRNSGRKATKGALLRRFDSTYEREGKDPKKKKWQ